MLHILQPTSGNSSIALSRSSEPDEYHVDSDFEARLISQTEVVEKALKKAVKKAVGDAEKPNAKAIKRKARVETATPTFKATKAAKRDAAAFLPEPLTSDTDEDHGPMLAAIDRATKSLVYPTNAHRRSRYSCQACNRKVHLKAGPIRRAHFAHYRSDTSCTFYAHSGESKEHKRAKQLLKTCLELRQRKIVIRHSCSNADPESSQPCHGDSSARSMELLDLRSNERVVLEYPDPGRKWVADLAILDEHGKLRFIIEVKQAHFTTTERPEPWFEVGAKDIIRQYLKDKYKGRERMELEELRQERPGICDDCKRMEEPWVARIKVIPRWQRPDGSWGDQHVPCLRCGSYSNRYKPQWIKVEYRYRQVCKTCISRHPGEIKERFGF